MDRNIVFCAVILIAVATAYSFLGIDRMATMDEVVSDDLGASQMRPLAQAEMVSAQTAEQQRKATLRAEYEKLEQAREGVRKQLGLLKFRLWKLRVSPEQSRAIQEQMQQGYTALKNPPLLGAFSSVDEIAREIEKMSGISVNLKTLEMKVENQLAGQNPR